MTGLIITSFVLSIIAICVSVYTLYGTATMILTLTKAFSKSGPGDK